MQTWILQGNDVLAWQHMAMQIDCKQDQHLYLIDLSIETLDVALLPGIVQSPLSYLLAQSSYFCYLVPEYCAHQTATGQWWYFHLYPTAFCQDLPNLPYKAAINLQVPHAVASKPWYQLSPHQPITNAIVIGAGIAGAATAFSLAKRGIPVTVLEAKPQIAQAASGNQQGLLYAKISPHFTTQTQLLLAGYGYSLRLLHSQLPKQDAWQECGVLHLDFDEQEQKRNALLAKSNHPWFTGVDAQKASELAGIAIKSSGLFWPKGAWLNPKTWVQSLLAHPNITVHTNSPLLSLTQKNKLWQIQTPIRSWQASHVFLCMGDKSVTLPILESLHFNLIRGQTDLAAVSPISQALKVALSGKSYISPAWQGQHCFGASFVFHDKQTDWREKEQRENMTALQALNPLLASGLRHVTAGHAAIRCDASDHLPIVGAIGNFNQMQQDYQALRLDKNYHINTPCSWQDNLYINTAHGTRGLATAPICAEGLVAEALGEPPILGDALRCALHPNRFVIRDLIKQK